MSSQQIVTIMQTRSLLTRDKISDKIQRRPCADTFCQIQMERDGGKIVLELHKWQSLPSSKVCAARCSLQK